MMDGGADISDLLQSGLEDTENSEWNIDSEKNEESTSDEDDEEIIRTSKYKNKQADGIIQPGALYCVLTM